MHSLAGRDVLRRIHDVYRESTQSQLAQNIQHLFRMLPSHSPLRAPLVGILTQNLPMADAITLTGTSSAYINRARRSPPADSSPLFARYPHGVHRDKVKNVERDRTIALLTEHALIKYDAAQRPSYLHYDTCSEFYELYRVHMPDICSCILALVEADVIDRDDDLSSFMRRNLDLVEEYSSTFLALQESLPQLYSPPLAIIASYLVPGPQPRSRGFIESLKSTAKIRHADKSFLGCQCKASPPLCFLDP